MSGLVLPGCAIICYRISAQRILPSLAEGHIRGRSYAIVPYQRPISNNRLWGKLQLRSIGRELIDWLQALVSKHSKGLEVAQVKATFIEPLRYLRSVQGMSPAILSVVANSIERLETGAFCPRVAPMHNDLWKGNVLLVRHPQMKSNGPYPFFVIDWRGSRIEGYPFFDLVRFSMSFALTPAELKREINIMSEHVGCNLSDAKLYLAGALGEIAMRLDHFPLHNFLSMAAKCFTELQKAEDLF